MHGGIHKFCVYILSDPIVINQYFLSLLTFLLMFNKHLIMKVKKIYICILILAITVLTGCTKEEGEGGTSSITGKVYVLDYNFEYTTLLGEYYAQEEDVYIVYGDDEVYSDRFDTHHDGTYRFQYLRQGTYTVYAYSEDTTGGLPLIPIEKTVEITGNNQVVEAEDIVIVK